jgi:hypothetical protein
VLEQLLREDGYSVSRHTFSDILRDTLGLWDLPHTRDNLQKMAIVMNAESGFGDGSLSRAMRRRLMEDTADVTILDGVRWLGDEKMIRSLNDDGIKTVMVYIAADAKVRYGRLARAEPRRRGCNDHGKKFLRQERYAHRGGYPGHRQPRRDRAREQLRRRGTLQARHQSRIRKLIRSERAIALFYPREKNLRLLRLQRAVFVHDRCFDLARCLRQERHKLGRNGIE